MPPPFQFIRRCKSFVAPCVSSEDVPVREKKKSKLQVKVLPPEQPSSGFLPVSVVCFRFLSVFFFPFPFLFCVVLVSSSRPAQVQRESWGSWAMVWGCGEKFLISHKGNPQMQCDPARKGRRDNGGNKPAKSKCGLSSKPEESDRGCRMPTTSG